MVSYNISMLATLDLSLVPLYHSAGAEFVPKQVTAARMTLNARIFDFLS